MATGTQHLPGSLLNRQVPGPENMGGVQEAAFWKALRGVPRPPSGTHRFSDSGWAAFMSGQWHVLGVLYPYKASSGAVSVHSKQDSVWAGGSGGPGF